MDKQKPHTKRISLPLAPPPEIGCCGEIEEIIGDLIGHDWRTVETNMTTAEKNDPVLRIAVTPDGNLRLPESLKERWAITEESELLVNDTREGIVIRPAAPPLSKIYVEPTTACNYHCRTCVRNTWEEKIEFMAFATFKKMIEDLKSVKTLREIAFWGIGEPLMHPDIIEMVSLAKDLGAKTEIITNGALLTRDVAHRLIEAGLDTLVVSIDGTSSDSYGDIRRGGDFEQVKENMIGLQRVRWELNRENPEIGVELVIMKRNLEQLSNLAQTARDFGAVFIVLSNLLPHTKDMMEDILYWHCARMQNRTRRTKWSPEIVLPRVDMCAEYLKPIGDLLYFTGRPKINLGQNAISDEDHCPFIWQGSTAVTAKGDISPCIALMHAYRCFVLEKEKVMKPYLVGNVADEHLMKIWEKEEYKAFRKRVRDFDFSPCVDCGGCDFSESNEEDCYGNTHPVCGDCLWARRVILCP